MGNLLCVVSPVLNGFNIVSKLVSKPNAFQHLVVSLHKHYLNGYSFFIKSVCDKTWRIYFSFYAILSFAHSNLPICFFSFGRAAYFGDCCWGSACAFGSLYNYKKIDKNFYFLLQLEGEDWHRHISDCIQGDRGCRVRQISGWRVVKD